MAAIKEVNQRCFSGTDDSMMPIFFIPHFTFFPLSSRTFSLSVCGAQRRGNRSCPVSLAVPTSHNPGMPAYVSAFQKKNRPSYLVRFVFPFQTM